MTIVRVATLMFVLGMVVGHFGGDLAVLAVRNLSRRNSSRENRMKRPIFTTQRVQWAMLIFAVTVLLFEGLAFGVFLKERAEYTRCIATWQQQKSTADAARSEAAEEVSGAIDAVIYAVAAKDSADFKAAIENYVQIRKDQDQARAENPVPAPPTDVCGPPRGN